MDMLNYATASVVASVVAPRGELSEVMDALCGESAAREKKNIEKSWRSIKKADPGFWLTPGEAESPNPASSVSLKTAEI